MCRDMGSVALLPLAFRNEKRGVTIRLVRAISGACMAFSLHQDGEGSCGGEGSCAVSTPGP